MGTVETPMGIQIMRVDSAEIINRYADAFARAYKTVFSGPPYFESFSKLDAEAVLRQLATTRRNITLLAVTQADEVAGFGIAVPLAAFPTVARELTGLVPLAHTAYLAELGVAPDWRGQGLGKALTKERIRLLDNAAFSHVVLRVGEGSGSADMYRNLHFTDMGVNMEVAHKRIDGKVSRDTRFFMSRVLSQVQLD